MHSWLNNMFCIFFICVLSGSSAGDLGDVTPCNASPSLSGLVNVRTITRHDTLEVWTSYVQSMSQGPANALHLFQQLQKLIRVRFFNNYY